MLQRIRRCLTGHDDLTPLEAEIARKHLPIPGEPVSAKRGGFLAVFRHKEAVVVAGIVLSGCSMLYGGYWAGTTLEDHRQDERIEAEFSQADAEFWALSDAYSAAYEEEMRARGYSREEIERARWDSLFGKAELPPPREADTLEIRAEFNAAGERRAPLLDLRNADH